MESAASPALGKDRIPGLPNPVVAAAQQKWLFTDEELERTPSRIDKINREKEDYIRHRAVEFIWQVSMMLKMPPQTSMTATVFMHRFLMRYSLRGQYPEQAADLMHPKVIAAVALFVAFKVDETMRRMKDFVVACCRVAMKQADLIVDEQSKDYWKWRDLILQNESVMLEFLCFDLQLESPYRILWDYTLFFNVPENRPLRHAAYAFLNDSTYTVLCLQFPPRVVAAAALYAAARHCNVAFPDDAEGRPWWEQIDVRVDDLIRACSLIVKIYERVQQNLSKGYPDFAIGDSDPNDPTRLFHSNPASASEPPSNLSSLTTPAGGSAPVNGRKRSREPESHASEERYPTPVPQPQPQSQSSLNGGRSPKRQRTISPGLNVGTTVEQPTPRPRIPLRAMGLTPAQARHGGDQKPSPNDGTDPSGTPSGLKPNLPKADPSSDDRRDPSAYIGPGDQHPKREDLSDEGGGSEEGEI
ncbi:uncharacterized protein N7459_004343 [Penicillium hispanicum]|uniref:uncharacterized protein n=1 Tax=Penicillium hispanicum TaxID=1080232 RepID=UPI0025417B01|nr:uncharacterized protein N7459_004343 [Penicillium hispanicum]KAJ5584543.1 hypothetical protein N7459_004343 [Penicillium hispanicum]